MTNHGLWKLRREFRRRLRRAKTCDQRDELADWVLKQVDVAFKAGRVAGEATAFFADNK